jgi:hypothetical protein
MSEATLPLRLTQVSASLPLLSEQDWALTERADSKRATEKTERADLIVIMVLEL